MMQSTFDEEPECRLCRHWEPEHKERMPLFGVVVTRSYCGRTSRKVGPDTARTCRLFIERRRPYYIPRTMEKRRLRHIPPDRLIDLHSLPIPAGQSGKGACMGS